MELNVSYTTARRAGGNWMLTEAADVLNATLRNRTYGKTIEHVYLNLVFRTASNELESVSPMWLRLGDRLNSVILTRAKRTVAVIFDASIDFAQIDPRGGYRREMLGAMMPT